MIITDLIVLGMAVPNEIKDGRKTVCLGGYSDTHGYIRIYPCRVDMKLSRWDIIEVEVERNPKDTRHESWKLQGSNPEWESLNERVSIVGSIKKRDDRRSLLQSIKLSGVSVINANKDSLGIVQPTQIHKAYFQHNPHYKSKPRQQHLIPRPGEEWIKVKAEYPFEPVLEYTCPVTATRTGMHTHKVIEWGAFEWMRKNPDKANQYWQNVRILDPEYDVYLLVGNQNLYRNSFIVINIITMKRDNSSKSKTQRQLRLI